MKRLFGVREIVENEKKVLQKMVEDEIIEDDKEWNEATLESFEEELERLYRKENLTRMMVMVFEEGESEGEEYGLLYIEETDSWKMIYMSRRDTETRLTVF